MVLDQAGWYGSRTLRVPSNITLVPLPPYAPEFNRVERVWLYLIPPSGKNDWVALTAWAKAATAA